MENELAVGMTAIVIFGVGAQWIAARLRIPSILVLLVAGVIAGPVTGLLDPAELFGDLLFPLVSLAVGLLLFEGGLGLRLEGFRRAPSTVIRLVTMGALLTWLVAAGAAALLFDLSTEITLLLGAILVVSGPTVVIPLVRLSRPRSPIAETLRWEGIVIDPIGAALAVMVLNVALGRSQTWYDTALDMFLTVTVGVAIGLAASVALTFAIMRFHIGDHLLNPVALLFAIASFTIANAIIGEAGLFATTTLGIALANQRFTPTSAIVHFQEELGPLLLASLFIVLGAQVDLAEVAEVALPSAGLALILMFVARPLVVGLSTIHSGLSLSQRLYLASIAPRGIVAASVAALFSLELEHAGIDADLLVPITFCVIFYTVLAAGVVVVPLARTLGVAMPPRNGLVLVGDQEWVVDLATAVGTIGVPSLIVSSELSDDGDLPPLVEMFDGRASSDALLDLLDLRGVSDAVITIGDPERAAFAAGRLVGALGRRHVYRLPKEVDPGVGKPGGERRNHGRPPFGTDLSQHELHRILRGGGSFATVCVAPDHPLPPGNVALVSVDTSGYIDVETTESAKLDHERRVVVLVTPATWNQG